MPHPNIQLVVGLGNPGTAYQYTYHNAGFLALEWLLQNRADGGGSWKKAGRLFEYAKSSGIIWIKPMVFMNESGIAVAKAKKRFGTPAENILVIHDDSDIEIGLLKLSFGRSSAGHRGVESVIGALRSNQFWRLRIGVRASRDKKKALDFVLKKISRPHRAKLIECFEKIPELINLGEN
ncbi:MAG: aminoacyl-tRNA hydrolase [Candidatus Liptonbacteria bacterium]|nr:aminoacyl-tRNA hydrolase [Candidatus Liptonbacteria bacterium]